MNKVHYLNFTDLNEEAKESILSMARAEIEENRGEELKKQAKSLNLSYDIILEAEAERHIYTFNFKFNV